MKKPQTVSHPGVVEEIQAGKTVVKILSMSACASCHAQGACNMADMAEKFVDVYGDQTEGLVIGQKVKIEMRKSMGGKAVLIAYVYPMLFVLVGLIGFLSVFHSEGLAALLSLALLIPYYLIVHVFREKLKKDFEFNIVTE